MEIHFSENGNSILNYGSIQTPNPWNDKLVLASFQQMDDQNNVWEVKKIATISVGAFCVAQMFPDSSFKKMNELVSISTNNHDCRISISPYIEDTNHVKPFCFFGYMDDYFSLQVENGHENHGVKQDENINVNKPSFCWYDSWDDRYDHFLWLPILFNAGGCVRTFKYKATFLENNVLRVEKHYELEY